VTSSRACVHIDNPPTSLRDYYTQNVLLNKHTECASKQVCEQVCLDISRRGMTVGSSTDDTHEAL
jgi:hypothetical protein